MGSVLVKNVPVFSVRVVLGRVSEEDESTPQVAHFRISNVVAGVRGRAPSSAALRATACS